MKTPGAILTFILVAGVAHAADPTQVLPPAPTKPTVSGTLTVIKPAEVRGKESVPAKPAPDAPPRPREFDPHTAQPVTLSPPATNTATADAWWKPAATNWPAPPKKTADPWK